MKCKCQYFLMDSEGVRRCSVCGSPANPENSQVAKIADKMVTQHSTKHPIFPAESKRMKKTVKQR